MAFCVSNGLAQIEPAIGIRENTPAVHALKNLTIIVAPGKRIEKGTIVVRGGVIESAGANVAIPADARVWDCSGLTAYAGLIDLYTDIGQSKPPVQGQVSSPGSTTQPPRGSAHWNSHVHPENSGAELFLPDKEAAEKFRALGFTTALSAPSNGIFRGSSALVALGDGSANALLVRDNVTQNVSFSRDSFGDSYPTSLMGAIALIRQTFIDANWYADALKIFAKNPAQERPEENRSLSVLEAAASGKQPVIFETTDEQNILRAAKIAKEFSLSFWIRGNGYEYRRLDAVKETKAPIILPVNFPDAPNVNTPEEALDVSLEELRHWDFAPENPARLKQAGIPFALTTSTLKDVSKFRMLVRTAIDRGLKADDALAALTTIPAKMLGMEKQLGTIESGKAANFVLTDGELFGEKTKIRETWVDGKRYEVKAPAQSEVRGAWSYSLTISTTKKDTGSLTITGEPEALSGMISRSAIKIKMASAALAGKNIALEFAGDSLGYAGVVRLTGVVQDSTITGTGEMPDGSDITWLARLTQPFVEPPDTTKKPEAVHASFDVVYPDGAFGRKTLPERPENILVKGGYVWTSGPQGNLENTDILYTKGKVAKIGKNIDAPKGAVVIDATGKHVTAGLIDCHSHTAISDGVNEAGQAISAEVRIGDVVDANDVAIYRELAGGLTVAHLLHGSANPIGGQNQVVKLRWGMPADDMKFEGAPKSIKFALGENVKQSNWGERYTTRYPQTRMGVEQIIRDEFSAARDYEKKMEKAKEELDKIPPRRDLELDAIVEILNGTRLVHSHSYRQDEILMLMRVADDYGFKVATFQHGLEGYKIAEAIARHGAGVSTFSDWWAYKYEVIDAIPYNGALMHDVGVVVSYNSDSDELARRLNTEAAKAVKYGSVSEEEALKFVTINPAKQLRIDNRVGSIEVGKDADFVIWSGSPLSTYSVCEQTWIDGRRYFDRDEDRAMNAEVQKERTVLIQKILAAKKSGPGSGTPVMPSKKSSYSCHIDDGGAK
jgi:imidazolonepropionase-like amidohydrolase